MNLYHLRYFVTLAHLEHYTKAAEILSITQPSLSHAISNLEKELGVKLFEKEGRNIVLTKCGNSFLSEVEHALNLLESSISNLQMTGFGEGLIDIAHLRVLGTDLVPSLVRGYLTEHPMQKIDFHFHNNTGLTPNIIEGLKEKKYDIAFCSRMENEPTVDFVPIAKQELVIITPANHPLASADILDLSDTLPYPQIVFSKLSGLRPIIDGLFHECGGKPMIAYEMDEDEAVAGFVANNFGMAVVPYMPLLEHLAVKIIRINYPLWERRFYMATIKNSYHAPAIENFMKYVIEHAEI